MVLGYVNKNGYLFEIGFFKKIPKPKIRDKTLRTYSFGAWERHNRGGLIDITLEWLLMSHLDKSDICRTWGSFRKEREN